MGMSQTRAKSTAELLADRAYYERRGTRGAQIMLAEVNQVLRERAEPTNMAQTPTTPPHWTIRDDASGQETGPLCFAHMDAHVAEHPTGQTVSMDSTADRCEACQTPTTHATTEPAEEGANDRCIDCGEYGPKLCDPCAAYRDKLTLALNSMRAAQSTPAQPASVANAATITSGGTHTQDPEEGEWSSVRLAVVRAYELWNDAGRVTPYQVWDGETLAVTFHSDLEEDWLDNATPDHDATPSRYELHRKAYLRRQVDSPLIHGEPSIYDNHLLAMVDAVYGELAALREQVAERAAITRDEATEDTCDHLWEEYEDGAMICERCGADGSDPDDPTTPSVTASDDTPSNAAAAGIWQACSDFDAELDAKYDLVVVAIAFVDQECDWAALNKAVKTYQAAYAKGRSLPTPSAPAGSDHEESEG